MRRLLPLLVLVVFATTATASSGRPEGSFALRGTVLHAVDGDTLAVRLDSGREERVRLIGIDTPERGECYAGRATGAARALADDRPVLLVGDATQDTRDRYGRLLAYAWVDGRRDLGFQLVVRGLARVYVYRSAFARLGPYRYAESLGRRRAASVYHGCGAPAPLPAAPAGATGARCDPSYPDVCIPPAPPDLDCAQVGFERFRVVGRDPHGFDGDGDGIGCEG
ncbi:MAG: thermonuclease family protein [Actinobacteria bacterium]|nr:thermonuclease family protein [Actinomycetota bacterium]